ncbi:hypothetical protein LUX57_21440 [Actinomadura madurae]|uniref:hypothetical protein n=1 Tax=Actinomadura madurae TaxID=1993 RepID=UPI0020D25545|nr:hypothetical protein [Actinomadura madurae]MCP9967363.1 hypothetical protein [Actinomadura madurae]
MSSQVNGRPTGPGGTVKDQEIAAEQRYVDIAYARLEEMRADAQAMIREGYRQSLAGTKGSLVDRDAMVHQAALRAQALDVADDGLVFGGSTWPPARSATSGASASAPASTTPW